MIHDDITHEARRIVEAGETRGLLLRLLGGLAIRLRSPSAQHRALARSYPDIDLATASRASQQIEALIAELGYAPDREFNVLNGAQRLLFFDAERQRQVDVFVGGFEMCHRLPLAERLHHEPLTLPLAELLLTKLQIVQINEKDLRDCCALLLDHPVATADGDAINADRIGELCGKDWGLWKTVSLSLDKVRDFGAALPLDSAEAERIRSRVANLQAALEAAPKSFGWKARSRIGTRLPWYELPEEVQRG